MKSYYIATGLERSEEAKALSEALKALGLTPSYEWWKHGSVQADGPGRIAEVAVNELSGVSAADLFVALLPGGRGTHTELGYALCEAAWREDSALQSVARKTILIVGPTEDASGRTCCFYLHPQVAERFVTVAELLAWLKSWRRCNPLPSARSA